MSLTRRRRAARRRGRVAHAQLGINQLGACTRPLLSFRDSCKEGPLPRCSPHPRKADRGLRPRAIEAAEENESDGTTTAQAAQATGQGHDE